MACFSVLGVLLSTVLAKASYGVQLWLSRVAGLVIIFFAFQTLGLLKLDFLEREYRLDLSRFFGPGFLNSFVFGAAFAVGWTPCVGPILGSLLALAV